ncbi:hypothetical protein [Falsiroseomonas sp.]|uniref:hypothetical protein n=1 Tax=Falsiroseomonas sp. TaxID=2870721 RepID=UPI0035674734
MKVAGFSPVLGAVSAMLVWAAHFLVIYTVQATLCVRIGSGHEVLGLPLIPATVLGLTAAALVVVVIIGLRARNRLVSGMSGQEGEDEPQFTLWMTMAIALVSALAIVWEAVPVLILPPCA